MTDQGKTHISKKSLSDTTKKFH